MIYLEEFMHSSKLNVFLLASRPISTLIISLSIHSSIIWKLKKIVSKMYSCSPQEKNSCWLDFLRNGFRDEWCQLIKKLSHSSLYLQIWILKLSSQTDIYQNIQIAFYWNIWAEKINFQCKNYVNLLWKYFLQKILRNSLPDQDFLLLTRRTFVSKLPTNFSATYSQGERYRAWFYAFQKDFKGH